MGLAYAFESERPSGGRVGTSQLLTMRASRPYKRTNWQPTLESRYATQGSPKSSRSKL